MADCASTDSFENDVNGLLQRLLLGQDAPRFHVAWIARLTAIDTTRSVLEHIAYIIRLQAVY